MANAILVVDDDPGSREVLAELLRNEGNEVYIARHGSEALAMLPRLPRPCTILLDLYMPEMGGAEFLNRLVEVNAALAFPVVIMSADKAPGESYRNTVATLSKPFEFDDLRRALARAAAETGALRG
jgi:CheY-like chemotaxis protein